MNHPKKRRSAAGRAPCDGHVQRALGVGGLLLVLALAATSHGQPSVRKLSTLAQSSVDVVHAEVTGWVDAIHRAKGPARYAALRGLWRSWEHADPTQVEEALASLGQDGALEPAVRAYAQLLAAYARRRRGDLFGSQRAIAALGFVKDWLIVGPFENHNKRGFDDRFVPELELDEPVLLDRSMSGKQRPVRWRVAPDVSGYGWLDAGAMLRPNRDICAFATTYVRAKRPRTISLWVGAGGAFKLFWNSQEVLSDGAYRALDADRWSVAVQLHAGFNRITAKICGDSAPPALSLRLAELDGTAARDLLVKADVATSTAAASAMRRTTTVKPTKKRLAQSAKGPLQLLNDQLAAASKADKPAVLERYARYLMVTGGDAEASHVARDYARRAAKDEPTIERLLLAASLAEDRNGQRLHVERADKLPSTRAQRLEVLLARARLARSGPNWLEAVPLYDDVLRIDSNNVPALLGRVDLYVEAGLPRTALATLRRALAVRPRSVALLRAMSGQLRALGRDTEAAEIEARYAALRFDDGGYLKQQLSLAVARRDDAGARRWAKRLLASEPGSAWAHGVVARSLRALGDFNGAEATYRSALEIAPDDVGNLSALADLYGVEGFRDKQIVLLKRIMRLRPQAKNVRAYLEHIQPAKARDDEKYAWSADKLLELRTVREDSPHELRVLRRLAVTTVFENGLAAHFKQLAFQPLTEAAARRAQQYVFTYHADRQVVQLRGAKIYRRDGRVDETVATGEAPANDPSINMYTLQRNYYVRFGRIEPGDVVELRYRVEDVAARNEMSDYFGEVTFLQSTDPIASVEYVLVTPKSRNIHLSTSPLAGLTKHVSVVGDRRIHRIKASNVPPVPIEPSMPPLSELLAHVHVSTFPSWAAVGQYYWGLARDKLDVDDDVRNQAQQLAAGLTTERDKVAAIYGFAATKIRYVALELGIEGIRPRGGGGGGGGGPRGGGGPGPARRGAGGGAPRSRWRAAGATAKTRRR